MSTEEVEVQHARAVEVGRAVVGPLPPNNADSTVQDMLTEEELTKSGVANGKAVKVSARLLKAEIDPLIIAGKRKILRGSDSAHGRDSRWRSSQRRLQDSPGAQPWKPCRLRAQRRTKRSAVQVWCCGPRERPEATIGT